MYDPDKVDDYSKKELAEMIFNGEVSREQIDEDGLFLKHRRLLDVELSLMAQEEIDWTEATTKNTIRSYQVYLDKYNPTIVEGETVTDGWVENSAYIGHHIEEALRLQSLARKGEDDKKDKPQENPQENIDWAKAEHADSIEAYRNYIVKYESLGGKHLAEAKQKLNQLEGDLASILTSLWRTVSKNDILPDADDKEWGKACKTNTITAYRLYLDKYDGQNSSQKGKYIPEANKRINKLMDEACWANAVKQNTNEAYQNYIGKYPQGIHLAEAHNRLRPPVPPKPIFKYVLTLMVATICIFFGIQYLKSAWPFSHKEGTQTLTPIAEVDSLQWAIDNHDIPLLTRFAELDSARAYYPLSTALWAQRKDTLNSLTYIRKAIDSIDKKDTLYANYVDHLELLKNNLDYYGTIGHVMQPLPANIEERLPILVNERRISERAILISKKYNFPYKEDWTLEDYINDDFDRWVKFARKTQIIPSKIDAYKAALQLKEDIQIRKELETIKTTQK